MIVKRDDVESSYFVGVIACRRRRPAAYDFEINDVVTRRLSSISFPQF